ncbi:MAG: hypothetical protein U0V70_22095 [Terriglobia bacterium]
MAIDRAEPTMQDAMNSTPSGVSTHQSLHQPYSWSKEIFDEMVEAPQALRSHWSPVIGALEALGRRARPRRRPPNG